jgi:dolichol-phosphate mannosyltransferase
MATSLSVIVPAYDEAPNIRPLTERVTAACKAAGLQLDLLIMDDDSGAGTVETERVVKELQAEGFPVRLHIRRSYEGRGLGSAVLLGFFMARYDAMLCMDADLQHLPEDVPRVAAPVLRGDAEFTVGSRNVAGGKVQGWTLPRQIISAGATLLARPLTPCSDPMSGFFCLTAPVLARGHGELNPLGFKIALEIMVKCGVTRLQDVPITFADRQFGESKLDSKTTVLYVQQLAHLYWYQYWAALLGAAGLLLVALLAGAYALLAR